MLGADDFTDTGWATVRLPDGRDLVVSFDTDTDTDTDRGTDRGTDTGTDTDTGTPPGSAAKPAPGTGPGTAPSPPLPSVTGLLLRVRNLLADFGAVRRTAVEHLWEWGADPSDTDEDRAEFTTAMHPSDLVVSPDGGFALHYQDTGGRMPDGYWPAVHFAADGTPVRVTVES
ncbi:hypothetical protein ACWDR0_28960 [Streptomyces sp. NPDC003691]